MVLELTLGDVIRTHLKTQGRQLSSIPWIADNYGLCADLVFGAPDYTGIRLPMEASSWLVKNIGLTTGYWRNVNKVLDQDSSYVQWKTVDLDALKEYAYGRSVYEPNIEIDTVISANTVLGTVLLYMDFINGIELQLQNCTIKFSCGFEFNRNKLWWRILRKWSEQDNPLDATILESPDVIAIEHQATGSYFDVDDMFHFTSKNKDHWISPIRAVAKSNGKMRIEWNHDFVSIMKQPVTSVSPEEQNGIRWKDYL